MKRLFAILAAVLCVCMLSTSVFAAPADAYSMYQASVKKMEKVQSAKIRGSMKITLSSDILSMDTKLSFTILQRINSKGELEMSMAIDKNEFGIESASYYRDGYYYTNENGVKTRTRSSLSMATELGVDELPKTLFQDATVEKVEDGNRIKVKIPSKYLDELMGTTVGALADPGDKASSVTCYYTIDSKGYMKKQQMIYSTTMKEDGVSAKAKYTITMNYSSINNVGSINFPSDLSSYRTV